MGRASARQQEVSIHAPGRGATIITDITRWEDCVSIHAPGRGATKPRDYVANWNKFQFTHPGGVRLTV